MWNDWYGQIILSDHNTIKLQIHNKNIGRNTWYFYNLQKKILIQGSIMQPHGNHEIVWKKELFTQ